MSSILIFLISVRLFSSTSARRMHIQSEEILSIEERLNESLLVSAGKCDKRCKKYGEVACTKYPKSCSGCKWCPKEGCGNTCGEPMGKRFSVDCFDEGLVNQYGRQLCAGCDVCIKLRKEYNLGPLSEDVKVASVITTFRGGFGANPNVDERVTPSISSFRGGLDASPKNVWKDAHHTIGQGMNGRVIRVTRSDDVRSYALKQALSPKGNAEILWEIEVMQETQCKGVMEVVDGAPCFQSSQPLPAAYVSFEMAGTLWGWYDWFVTQPGKTVNDVRQCAVKFHQELKAAIRCLHRENKGYLHGDLKGDNIYFSKLDRFSCPIGLKIADFGLASKLGTKKHKYSSKYWNTAGHMPAYVFERKEKVDPISQKYGLKSSKTHFIAHQVIDWCSYVFMMYIDFGLDVMGNQNIDCGMMGVDRDTRVIL